MKRPVEGFGDPVGTDGSLLVVAGRWGACGWSVVQLDHDEEMAPMHGMYVPLDAEFELQRTVDRSFSVPPQFMWRNEVRWPEINMLTCGC